MTPIPCTHCGAVCTARWQTFINNTRHARADCPKCGFVQYLTQTPEVVALCDADEVKRAAERAGLFDDVGGKP